MEDLKIFIYEKLKLNNQSQLATKNICDLYDRHKNILKYKDTEINLKDLKNNHSLDTINILLKIIGIIIDNVSSINKMIIQSSIGNGWFKVSCYSKSYDDNESNTPFLGNILIYERCFTQSINGINVEFKKRDPLLYSNTLSLKNETIMNNLENFIQPIDKKFKIYQ